LQVLQEVAAAKQVVVACGNQIVSGDNFYREVIGVSNHYASFQKMLRKIRPAVELMSPSAAILLKQSVPLLELIETYRSWNATKAVDKVYSLLNFSSDAHNVPSLQPDYSISEHELARRIVQFAFPGCVIDEQTDSQSHAITFEVEGHILGEISTKESGRGNGRKWSFDSRNLSGKSDLAGMTFNPNVQGLVGDGAITLLNERRLVFGYVCYLRGSSRPAVLNHKNGVFHVVMMATPPPAIGTGNQNQASLESTNSERTWDKLLPLLNNETDGMNKFRLTWDPFRQPTAAEASAYLPTPNNPEIQWEARLESMKEAALKKRAEGRLEDVHTCRTLTMLRLMYSQDRKEIKAGTSKYTITIHQAANEQLIGTLKLLLDANAPVDERDEKGLTALHYAAFVGNAEIVKALLQAKATVDVEHEKVGTPLSIAVAQQHPDVCRLLLLAGALSEIRSSASLVDPVMYGDLAAVKSLLDSGADPNSTEDIADIKGVTPLHIAAEMGHLEIARLLIQRGAKLDALTSTDTQPIHQAAMNGYDEVVALLLELGADVNCQDDNGATPLDFAIFRENYQTADMIREFGGKHNKLK
jgi:hypothetical protein